MISCPNYSNIYYKGLFIGGDLSMIIGLILLLLLMGSIIYFLYMVCIQFNYINNINLQFGMDVTKLYSDECDEGFLGYINYLVKTFAMNLYKVGLFFDRIIKSRH